MSQYKYILYSIVHTKIYTFYTNVAKKYRNTYDIHDLEHDINSVYNSIYKIENGLLRREPTIANWKERGYMANAKRWYFLYTINGDTINIIDVCHSQNMHERHEDIKQTIQLTESELKKAIKKRIQRLLNENCSVRRLAEYDVVNGDNQSHTVKGLEEYKDNLYDVRMYHSKDVTYCMFSIGKNTKKYICCRLEYDKEYGTWLGFTPIQKHKVPTIIKQDLKDMPTN